MLHIRQLAHYSARGTFLLKRVEVKSCFKNKRLMQVTILLWFLEIILGVYVYILLYVPI
jgi:uncharacterized membrane protein YozB (DUF420 family)